VTPRLAKVLPPDYALPTDTFIPPTRAEFFMNGQLEGKAPTPVPAPAPPGAALTPTPTVTPATVLPAATETTPSTAESAAAAPAEQPPVATPHTVH
jgi:pilus assembly protein CpaC